MRTTNIYIRALVSSLVIAATAGGAAGCTDTATPGTLDQPIGGAMSPTAGATANPLGGTTGGVSMPVAGASGGVGSSTAGASGGQPPQGGTTAGTAGTGAPVADGSVADPDAAIVDPLEIPDPIAAPYVWGYGVGITDIPAAVAFYTEVMKMTVEKEVARGDRTDTVLYATEADRGGHLVLMHFDDGRATRKITTKLVWQSSNAAAVDRAAAMHPDYVSRLNFGIVQFDGPETYIQEVGGIFDTEGGSITVPYPIAMGFAVSDLAASRTFYVDALGTTESSLGTFSVTDATGAGRITEYSYKYPDGPGIVLQSWSPARNAMNNPVMVVLFVPEAQTIADAIVAKGGSIAAPAARSAAYDNRLLIVAKDLDGYMIELVQ
jgi:catechol 2,3-dioxygenase-like lactoylglutathione lyase family enzyme